MTDERQNLIALGEEVQRRISVWQTDQERDAALVAAQRFYEETYGEIAHSSIYAAMAEYRERGLRAGGNYTANDDTYPTEIYFANGRRVGIAFDGDKPYLTIGRVWDDSQCMECGTTKALIRGQYPGHDKREVCPQCVMERLEDLETSRGTGQNESV